MFSAGKVEEGEEGRSQPSPRPISVGRLNIGQRYQAGTEQPDEGPGERQEIFKVRKLKKDIWAASSEGRDQDQAGDQVQLRGARRINKGKSERTSAIIQITVSVIIVNVNVIATYSHGYRKC